MARVSLYAALLALLFIALSVRTIRLRRRLRIAVGDAGSAQMLQRDDPAERRGYLRYFYRGWRPTCFGRLWSRAWAWVTGLGLTPGILVTLQAKDPSSGRLHATVLVVARYQGQRYLVSMLGNDSEWVRNVRAAGGRAFIKRGRSHPVVLAEIAPPQRADILKAWCQVATSGRQHLPVLHHAPVAAFEAIAADYPVFRIDPE
ncbi:MAG: nitroreductase family deazaflavin-dependent oxidoreductase [Dehalococcoidia bacterium]